MAVIWDIEGNDLLPKVDKVWMLCTEDTITGEKRQFSDYDKDLPSMKEGLEYLWNSAIIVGHNITGYDLVVLKKVYDWEPNPDTIIYDTWIMSLLNCFKRDHKHGLEGWGIKLGYPKIKFDDFSKYSKEMLVYCIRDVELNRKVYEVLVEEAKQINKINPLYKIGLMVENEFSIIEAEIRNHGWNFDHKGAAKLLPKMISRLDKIEKIINPMIGLVCMKVDSKDDFKKPLLKKNGEYALSTCKWFDIQPDNALNERLVDGDYCRITFEQGKISSDLVLKQWLFSKGWEPDEWNIEKIKGKVVRKSPKLTETSLEFLGETGKLISEYNSLANRHGILKGWLEQVEYDGRLHGRMWTIGTPTFRCRHEVVANLPKVGTSYGKEMRSLLLPRKGWVIVGSDSAGNQMRGLCHYIGNDDFTREVIEGDIHTRNANALHEFMVVPEGKTPRDIAKPFLYAFIFGGGPGKLALILCKRRDTSIGKLAIESFEESIPGLSTLREKLQREFDKTRSRFGDDKAFVRGIDGRLIFVGSAHQILNYKLQTLEGITCKAAAVYFKRAAKKLGIPYNFLLHYHDEFAVECPPEHAETLAALAKESFREAPKWFGVTCMDGDAKIGHNYAEVH